MTKRNIKYGKLPHVTGYTRVMQHLDRIKLSLASRCVELLMYLTAAVHFDFVGKIVRGEVEAKYELKPNSICYLLDMKWEKVHHNKLFLLTGGYVKSIKIINLTEPDKLLGGQNVLTAVVGIEEGGYRKIADVLERGGQATYMLGKDVVKTVYRIPPRPLWARYSKYMRDTLKSRRYTEFDSTWGESFLDLLNNFVERVLDGSKSKKKAGISVPKLLSAEQAMMTSYIDRNTRADVGTIRDLLDVAESQITDPQVYREYTEGGRTNIAYKLKEFLDKKGKELPDVFKEIIADDLDRKSKSGSDKHDDEITIDPVISSSFAYDDDDDYDNIPDLGI